MTMRVYSSFKSIIPALMLLLVLQMGCAEGLFWRGGQYVPWARNKWEEEERIANSFFTKKRQLDELVMAAENQPVGQQTAAADKLAKIAQQDPILLARIHATKLLGRLNCPRSIEALTAASQDANPDVRIAAVRSWARLPGEVAIPRLQEMIGSDTNVDVRLAATKALAVFPGSRSVAALSVAINDPNPALQVRAARSLAAVTGENLGQDVPAWKAYIANSLPQRDLNQFKDFGRSNVAEKSQTEQTIK